MATNQIRYRGRNDDGTETTATFKAALNTPWTQTVDQNFRVRFQVQNDTSAVSNLDVQLQYQVNSTAGTWINVNASSNVVRSSASANLADAANLTQQLGVGTGTFIGATAFDEVNGICGGTALDVLASGYFECEFSCQLRSADVVASDTIYLRTINSDTATGWNTYTVIAQMTPVIPAITKNVSADAWANEADGTYDLYADHYLIFSDPWLNLDDTDGAAYDRPAAGAGPTPKTANVPADAWANESDGTYNLYADHYLIFSDPWANLGDTAALFDKQSITTTPISVTPAADANAAYTDAFDGIKIGLYATTPDDLNLWAERLGIGLGLLGDSMTLADQTPVVDKQIVSATPITRDVPADAWGNLADITATIDKRGYLTASPPADSLGLYGDQTPPLIDARGYLSAAPAADANAAYTERLGLGIALLGDSMALADQTPLIDKQSITAAIEKNVPPDDLANYAERLGLAYLNFSDSLGLFADQTPTIDRRGYLTAAPAADSLGLYADQTPTIDERGYLTIAPPADANAAYTERLGLGIALLGDSMTLADQTPLIDKQSLTAALEKNVPADNLANYAERLGLAYLSFTDSMAMAEQAVNLYADHFVAFSDPWQTLGDTPALYDRPSITTTPKTANVPADANEAYADAFEGLKIGTVYADADDLNLWAERLGLGLGLLGDAMAMADQAPAIDKQIVGTSPIAVAVPADAWGNLADQAPATVKTTSLTAAPAADANAAYGERLARGVGLIDDLANYAERLGLGLSLRENLANYEDFIGINTGGNYRFSISDSLQLWGDSVEANLRKFQTMPADAMAMGDQPAVFAIGRFYPLTDAMPAYGELFGFGIGLIDSAPAYLDTAAAAEFGFLRAQLLDENEDYADALNILFLGFDELAAMFSDPLANWDDAAAYSRIILAIRIAGGLTDHVSLTGEVVEEQIAINGKAVENQGVALTGKVMDRLTLTGKVIQTSDITGELYIGES